ncbi:MAG: histidine phosphatase family protein [Planctomycetes bacterium]|nr:histidine phosphatase family protein [Planctomycetota bacterium]
MALIYLIRHAEAQSYWSGGDASRPLSARGRKQADWMARHLQGLRADELRCAPHRRCVETAEIIGAALGMQPEIDDRLHIARHFEVEPAAGTSIWVAHSNNIPDALYALGVPGNRCAHASAWKLELDDANRLTTAEYIEPDLLGQ